MLAVQVYKVPETLLRGVAWLLPVLVSVLPLTLGPSDGVGSFLALGSPSSSPSLLCSCPENPVAVLTIGPLARAGAHLRLWQGWVRNEPQSSTAAGGYPTLPLPVHNTPPTLACHRTLVGPPPLRTTLPHTKSSLAFLGEAGTMGLWPGLPKDAPGTSQGGTWLRMGPVWLSDGLTIRER